MSCEQGCDFIAEYECAALPAVKALERDVLGSDATLLDMPLNALEHAAQRAAADDIDGQVTFVNGNGAALPFADASFDRLSHFDVLCCLPEKLEMLCECRRVATDDARMHFSVIRPAHGLSEDDHRRALKTGPPLLDASGWKVLQTIDITQEFGDTIEKLIAGLKANTPELQEAYGADELRESWLLNEEQLDIVRANKLQRFVYIASPA